MNNKSDLDNILQAAKLLCDQQGARITPKRLMVLEVLLMSSVPLSAYELADSVALHKKQTIKPMSIYRILEFLVGQHLAHRLNMTNKYVACNKILCCQEHGVSQFLICSQCEQVEEVPMPKELLNGFMQQLDDAGCSIAEPHIEVAVVCKKCQSNNASAPNIHNKNQYQGKNNNANSVC